MQKKKRLPVGMDNFKKIIEQDCYYVDKTLMIKEFWENRAEATLIPRPRRFGKTLNISMFKYFFEKHEAEESHRHLFNGLTIEQHPEIMELQGKFPVITLTFKNIKSMMWQKCFEHMQKLIAQEFKRHDYLLKSHTLSEFQKQAYTKIITEKASQVSYETSLADLSHYLHDYHKQKPIILIDEYDAPIHAGFMHKYYDNVVNFMKIFLSAGLKNNSNLECGLLTGILRVSKESIFSGLNNLKICSLASDFYADKFGLTEQEVTQIFVDYNIDHKNNNIQHWYNGYTSGSTTIYNPWSIISCVDNKGQLKPYWVNVSDNIIIRDLITHADESFKEDIEDLITNKPVTKELNENIIFTDVFERTTTATWNFLLFSGYLTFTNQRLIKRTTYADLQIPNEEVLWFFENTITRWFTDTLGGQQYNNMLKSLVTGDIKTFKQLFTKTVIRSFSFFDVGNNEPERFYHAFVLGMLVSLNQTHEIKSNRESGFGRYDVMIIPRETKICGVIIEFKKVDTTENETLETAAANALKQIEEKQYEQELHDRKIKKIVKLAIAFEGKEVLIKESS